MILFKCIKCGAVIDAQEQYAGCEAACMYCNTVQTIPAESDPSCVLIFTEESPATGTPMTAAELNIRVEEGSVRPYDLILTDGMWQPLCAVFEMNDVEATDAQMEQCEELATDFGEMEPLPGHEKLPKLRAHSGRKDTGRDLSAGSGDAAGGAGVPRSALERVKLVAALAVVLVGVVCALRVFNASTGRSSLLIVRNSTQQTMQMATPWANQESMQLSPGQYTNAPAMDMAFGGSKRLEFTAEGGDGQAQSMKVSVAPARVTVVNLGRADYPLLAPDFDAAALSGIVAQFGKTLVQQLQSNAAPAALQQLCDEVDGEVKGKLLEYSSQEFFFEKKVCLDLFIAAIGRGIKLKNPRTANDRRPLLLPVEGGSLDIGNGGSVTLSPQLKCAALYADLGMASVTIAGQFSASGDAALKVVHNTERNEVEAVFSFAKEGKCSFAGQNLKGKWRCTMTCANGNWKWRWELVDASGRCRLLAEQGQNPRLQ